MDVRKFSPFTPGLLPGQVSAPSPADLAQVVTVTKVTAAGAWFELAVTPGHSYGPAPWGIGGYADVTAAIAAGWLPHVGDTALVVFAGLGVGNPWLLAWYRT